MAAAVATYPLASLWIVRHGERVDETDAGRAWKASSRRQSLQHFKPRQGEVDSSSSSNPNHAQASTPKARQFDPPLTEAGKCQSQEAVAQLKNQGFERIYASPCARTLAERPQAQKQGSLIAVQPLTEC